eukprot:430025-Alexandrium_andersonii.AAC.1
MAGRRGQAVGVPPRAPLPFHHGVSHRRGFPGPPPPPMGGWLAPLSVDPDGHDDALERRSQRPPHPVDTP